VGDKTGAISSDIRVVREEVGRSDALSVVVGSIEDGSWDGTWDLSVAVGISD